jgi:hypothetical protein
MQQDFSGTRPNAWDAAAKYSLARRNPLSGRLEVLETGVNFFVQALEVLGAETLFSCEGHPFGFSITFRAPYELALAVERVGYFSVNLSRQANVWHFNLLGNELKDDRGASWTDDDRRECLRLAADAWIREFSLAVPAADDSFQAFMVTRAAQRAGADVGNRTP